MSILRSPLPVLTNDNNTLNVDIPDKFIYEASKFRRSMMVYDCALQEITTKLSVLDLELGLSSSRNPIDSIKSRIKSPKSIISKMQKLDLDISVEAMKQNLNDIAGVRVICPYIDDIYDVVKMIEKQDDIEVITVKDYITNPKDNGYRSYHMIIEIPVFLSSGKHYTKVEIQLRTIAMDFWASLEHGIRYKKEHRHIQEVSTSLKECADIIAKTDKKMLEIRNLIDDE